MRKEISRRVVNERIIGSSNPMARWGRDSKQSCFGAFSGFFFGILIFFLTFMLPFSAARTEKDSKDISKLEVMDVKDAAGFSGKALLQGIAEPVDRLQVPRGSASDIIAFRYTVEKYETRIEEHDETHTEVRNGKDVEVTERVQEEVTEWVTDDDRSREEWSDVRFGHLLLESGAAGPKFDIPWQEIFREGDENTKLRETVEIKQGGQQCLLAIEMKDGNVVAEPDFFRLTDKQKDQLVSTMNSEEEGSRWMKIAFSVILWTIAFNLILGPAMLLFNIFPVKQVGGCARGIVTLLAFIAACVTTFITYVLTKFWWVIVLLIVGLAVFMIVKAMSPGKAEPDMNLDDDPDPDPERPAAG
ncbi:hypothetical protein KDL29_00025 [bacterium]|nr:hypothetical protein [bacterium]